MNILKLFYIISLLIISISCLRISDIPLPDAQSKIVINGLFSPDSTWKVNVAYANSTSKDENYFLPYIDNAVVKIYEEGEEAKILTYAQNGNYQINEYPSIGKKYILKVFVEGFDTIRATSSVPFYPSELKANWDLSQAIPLNDRWGGVFDAFILSLSFRDPIEESNRYMFGISYHDSCLCKIPNYDDSTYVDYLYDVLKAQTIESTNLPDAIFQDEQRVLISDETFPGQEKRVNLAVSDTSFLFYQSLGIPLDNTLNDSLPPSRINAITQRLYLKVYADTWSLSEELFDYIHSYFLQGRNTADPFSIYNNVSTNVKGGLGIFGGYQRKLELVYSD